MKNIIIPSELVIKGFPGGWADKESTCNVGDLSSIPGMGRWPGEENGYPLQYSGLENPMDLSMGLQRVGHNWVTVILVIIKSFPWVSAREEEVIHGCSWLQF